MHGFLEVDGIEDLDPVRLINDLAVLILHGLSVLSQFGCAPLEHFPALHQYRAFRKRFVNTENDNSLKNELFLWCTALEIACCHFLTD